MNEHMNDQGLCYCGSLDCIGNLRVMLESMNKDLAQANDQLSRRNGEYAELLTKLHLVEGWLETEIGKGEMTGEEYAEVYAELAEIIGFDMTREVEVQITWTQSVTVKVPLGEEITAQDFWSYDNRGVESNYPIENAESPEVEDVTHNRW